MSSNIPALLYLHSSKGPLHRSQLIRCCFVAVLHWLSHRRSFLIYCNSWRPSPGGTQADVLTTRFDLLTRVTSIWAVSTGLPVPLLLTRAVASAYVWFIITLAPCGIGFYQFYAMRSPFRFLSCYVGPAHGSGGIKASWLQQD